ncbi:MAG: YkgJ family cysteine cluster protein [Verrucomicrobiota bacterium]
MPSQEIHYQCQRCANCCRWPGEVVLTAEDITAIAKYLNLPESDFIAKHTRLRQNRSGLSLLEKADGSCEFLDGLVCRINNAKPAQCRDFPNKWNFPGWRQVCEAIPIRQDPHPAISPSNS